MKTIGLLGGMTWESTVPYYEIINRETQKRLGGFHSARIWMHSVDFQEILDLEEEGRWADGGAMLGEAAAQLVQAGAEIVLMCCNTMHAVSDAVEEGARRPLLHIADPLGEAIKRAGLSRVALLGTLFTMQMPGILIDRLKDKHGIDVVVPEADEQEAVHRIICDYQRGGPEPFPEVSRTYCKNVVAKLVANGAQGLILGCTELPLMLKLEDTSVPQFDTATLHALAVVDAALN